ncbi:hypothetical protein ACUY1T_11765 [Billgrantia sp. Q4P2]
MHQQAVLVSHRSFALSGWRRGWLAALLALILSLASAFPVLAHATSPFANHDTAENYAAASLQLPAPHCEHGHGWELTHEALLRVDRQDADSHTILYLAQVPIPPRVETTIGQPNREPLLVSPPIYLLTQRLRH